MSIPLVPLLLQDFVGPSTGHCGFLLTSYREQWESSRPLVRRRVRSVIGSDLDWVDTRDGQEEDVGTEGTRRERPRVWGSTSRPCQTNLTDQVVSRSDAPSPESVRGWLRRPQELQRGLPVTETVHVYKNRISTGLLVPWVLYVLSSPRLSTDIRDFCIVGVPSTWQDKCF